MKLRQRENLEGRKASSGRGRTKVKKNKERAVEEKAWKARRGGQGEEGKGGEKKEAKEEEEDGMWARESWSGFPDGQREENMWVR